MASKRGERVGDGRLACYAHRMESQTLTIAMIRDVFYQDDCAERLESHLAEAKSRGASIAVLPEIPANPWSPATKEALDDDAEPPLGRRSQMQMRAAGKVGIGLVGGAIIRDPKSGVRRNTALIINSSGDLIGTYCKLHVPEEPGFWETSHYDPGVEPPRPHNIAGIQLGVQICSDVNRPEGSHLLGAQGADVIAAPRSTEQVTYSRWKPVFIANAITSRCYVLSVDRPSPEQGVLIGQPSIAVAPNGEVLVESEETVTTVTLERAALEKAKQDYPGYLPVRADLYAKAWAAVSG